MPSKTPRRQISLHPRRRISSRHRRIRRGQALYSHSPSSWQRLAEPRVSLLKFSKAVHRPAPLEVNIPCAAARFLSASTNLVFLLDVGADETITMDLRYGTRTHAIISQGNNTTNARQGYPIRLVQRRATHSSRIRSFVPFPQWSLPRRTHGGVPGRRRDSGRC